MRTGHWKREDLAGNGWISRYHHRHTRFLYYPQSLSRRMFAGQVELVEHNAVSTLDARVTGRTLCNDMEHQCSQWFLVGIGVDDAPD
jgi:hypothetical protein